MESDEDARQQTGAYEKWISLTHPDRSLSRAHDGSAGRLQITNGSVLFELVPPYDSVASFLARSQPSLSASQPVSLPHPSLRPILCPLWDAIRTHFTQDPDPEAGKEAESQ